MAQATVTISDFSLTESWAAGGKPKGVEKEVIFTFTLPEGSRVSGCTQSFKAGSPLYGGDASVWYGEEEEDAEDIKKQSENTYKFEPNATARSVSVTFKFKSLGSSSAGTSSLRIENVKQLVNYSLPVTDFTLSTTAAEIGTTVMGTITSGELSLTRHYAVKLGEYYAEYLVPPTGKFNILQPPKDMLKYMTESHTGTVTVTLQTQSDKVVLHEVSKSLTVTCPNTYAPSIGTATVEGANLVELRTEDTPEDEEGEMIYFQGVSSATVTVEGLSTWYNASIKSVTVSVGNEYGDAQVENGAYKYTTGVFSEAGPLDITITVTDSRGLSTSEVVQIDVVEHKKPSFSSLRILRCDRDGTLNPEGTYACISADFTFDTTTGDAITPSVYYWYSVSATWEPLYCEELISGKPELIKKKTTFGDTTYIDPVSFGTQSNYDIKVTITDAYGGSASAIETLGTGAVFMRWEPENDVISFGCYPTTGTSKRVQISQDWDLYIGSKSLSKLVEEAVISALYPIGSVFMRNSNYDLSNLPTLPSGKTWSNAGTLTVGGTTYNCFEVNVTATAKSDEESGETSDETGDEA